MTLLILRNLNLTDLYFNLLRICDNKELLSVLRQPWIFLMKPTTTMTA
jgi:hypothetical protein